MAKVDYDYDFNILIVDDQESNLCMLNDILKEQYTVCIAKTGKSALRIAEEDKPDLILLDVIMPEMSGFEVLAQLKESEATKDIPVIFITGLDRVEDEEKGLLMGAVDYITKPFSNRIIKARIETHLKIVKQMRTIERFGLIDALTEIPNRRSFENQINIEWGRAVREAIPISLLMIDIDKFKMFNDTYGHQQGDVLLKLVAKTLLKSLKRTTDFVFRWGGEEFAVLLPNTALSGALVVAEKIRNDIEKLWIPHIIESQLESVTISIGAAALMPSVSDSITEFILKADQALYAAKRSGRNMVCSQLDL